MDYLVEICKLESNNKKMIAFTEIQKLENSMSRTSSVN